MDRKRHDILEIDREHSQKKSHHRKWPSRDSHNNRTFGSHNSYISPITTANCNSTPAQFSPGYLLFPLPRFGRIYTPGKCGKIKKNRRYSVGFFRVRVTEARSALVTPTSNYSYFLSPFAT